MIFLASPLSKLSFHCALLLSKTGRNRTEWRVTNKKSETPWIRLASILILLILLCLIHPIHCHPVSLTFIFNPSHQLARIWERRVNKVYGIFLFSAPFFKRVLTWLWLGKKRVELSHLICSGVCGKFQSAWLAFAICSSIFLVFFYLHYSEDANVKQWSNYIACKLEVKTQPETW